MHYYRLENTKENAVHLYLLYPTECKETSLGLYNDVKQSILYMMNTYPNSEQVSFEQMNEKISKRNITPKKEMIKIKLAVGYDTSIVLIDGPKYHLPCLRQELYESSGFPKKLSPGVFVCSILYEEYIDGYQYIIKQWKRVEDGRSRTRR